MSIYGKLIVTCIITGVCGIFLIDHRTKTVSFLDKVGIIIFYSSVLVGIGSILAGIWS